MCSDGKVRYALVGAGSRARMFIDPLATRFRDDGELVALADPNPGRLAYHNRCLVEELSHHEVPAYGSDDFDRMVHETRPDVVIVTTVDAYHHQYIVRAMELGCDAVTEKPMTIDADKCNLIMDTVQGTDRELRVAFNYRWAPGATRVRQVISEGAIGEVLHVDLEYWLDTSHGADYFRRWHRQKRSSGGLIIHKATHHFDLVNWWIDAVPETVYGMGRLAFYGKENAEARGEPVTYERYMDQDAASDPFAIDLSKNDQLRGLYLENEKYDGYFRDQNVFGEGVTIEDSMSLLVKYRTGRRAQLLVERLPAQRGLPGRLQRQPRDDWSTRSCTGQDGAPSSCSTRCSVSPARSTCRRLWAATAAGTSCCRSRSSRGTLSRTHGEGAPATSRAPPRCSSAPPPTAPSRPAALSPSPTSAAAWAPPPGSAS